jgi:hypothetical protein
MILTQDENHLGGKFEEKKETVKKPRRGEKRTSGEGRNKE